MDAYPVASHPTRDRFQARRWGDGDTTGGFLAEPQASFFSLEFEYPTFQRGMKMKKKIDITTVPELRTSVGMHGSLKQKEVGSALCLGVAVAILYAL